MNCELYNSGFDSFYFIFQNTSFIACLLHMHYITTIAINVIKFYYMNSLQICTDRPRTAVPCPNKVHKVLK